MHIQGSLTCGPVFEPDPMEKGFEPLRTLQGRQGDSVCRGCIISMKGRWGDASKVWANASKMADLHKYSSKWNSFPTKSLERVLKYSYLVSIILNFLFMFGDF